MGNGNVQSFNHTNIPNMTGKIAVVTGSNTGIGFAVSKELALKGATVIIAARNQTSVDEAVALLRRETNNQNIHAEIVDLASLQSIDSFGDSLSSKYYRIDILVNNAANFAPYHSKTVDGFEITLGVNAIGTTYVTSKLLPLIKKSQDGRIVFYGVGSIDGTSTPFFERIVDQGDIGGETFSPKDTNLELTLTMKMLNTLYAVELQRQLQEKGCRNIFIACTFPGFVNSGAVNREKTNVDGFFIVRVMAFLFPLLGATPAVGALSPLFLATAPLATVESYRSGLAGPGPNIKPIILTKRKHYNPANCRRVLICLIKLFKRKDSVVITSNRRNQLQY